jgi:hypothetical protein
MIMHYYKYDGRSQWPRGLRHEPSSPARKLGSWIRIQLKAWMSVCVYSVFVLLLCVGSCLNNDLIPRTKSPTDWVYDKEIGRAAKVEKEDCRDIDKK